jgi:hypothetical protein
VHLAVDIYLFLSSSLPAHLGGGFDLHTLAKDLEYIMLLQQNTSLSISISSTIIVTKNNND